MEKDKIYGPILRDLLVAANVPKGMIITVIIIIRSSHLHNDEQSAHTVDKCEIYFIVFFQNTKKISGSSKLYECNGVQPPPLNSHNKYYHVFILKLFIIIIYKNTIISMYDYVLVLRRTFLFLKYQICFNGIKMILQNSFELNTISVVPCFYNGT